METKGFTVFSTEGKLDTLIACGTIDNGDGTNKVQMQVYGDIEGLANVFGNITEHLLKSLNSKFPRTLCLSVIDFVYDKAKDKFKSDNPDDGDDIEKFVNSFKMFNDKLEELKGEMEDGDPV